MTHLPGYYEFACPVKIASGDLALGHLPYEMSRLGVERALVVTDAGVVGAGLLDRVRAVFEGTAATIGAVFDATPVDSSDRIVAEVAALYRAEGCDGLVAVGGGSCLDTAKGACVMLAEGTDDLLAFQGTERTTKPTPPLFAVPTTAGTGSEVTPVAVITNVDKGIKMSIVSSQLVPDVAIVDPKMTLSAPPKLTAATGMDALTHAMEAFYCVQKNPVSDAFALSAVRLVVTHLVPAVENGADERARHGLANAALLAGIAFSNSMVGVVHSLAHAAGALAQVPHGVANAIFLPWGIEYNLEQRGAIIAELGPAMGIEAVDGDPRRQARAVVSRVRQLTSQLNALCGLPLTLREAGVAEHQLEAMAAAALDDGSLLLNPEEVTFDDALDLLRKAY